MRGEWEENGKDKWEKMKNGKRMERINGRRREKNGKRMERINGRR